MKEARSKRHGGATANQGRALVDQVGSEVVRFQEVSNTVDTVAAAILAVDRQDLPCVPLLLFGGPATTRRLAESLQIPLGTARDVVARLELAGYARRRPGRLRPDLRRRVASRRPSVEPSGSLRPCTGARGVLHADLTCRVEHEATPRRSAAVFFPVG